MSNKKKKAIPQASHRPAAKPDTSGRNKMFMVVGLIVAAFIIASVVANATRSKNTTAGTSGTGSVASAPAQVPAEEQKYIGRLLPANYQEPKVQPVTYTAVTQMTDVVADAKTAQLSVSLADVTTNKIVYFEYAKAGGEAIPMIAYVKPSGKLFVGVSYCIPCKGKKQFVDADGTLTCSSCGTKRDLETGVGIGGACRLYPLDEVAAKIVGDKLVIDKSILDKWTPQPQDRKVG